MNLPKITQKPAFTTSVSEQALPTTFQFQTCRLDFPLDCRTVAPLLCMTELTVRKNVTHSPHLLPKISHTKSGRIIFWPIDVKEWQDETRQPAPRPRGAPTKVERTARSAVQKKKGI